LLPSVLFEADSQLTRTASPVFYYFSSNRS
jgi:hypothetical protein